MNEFETRMASMITIIMESDAYAQILEESGGRRWMWCVMFTLTNLFQ